MKQVSEAKAWLQSAVFQLALFNPGEKDILQLPKKLFFFRRCLWYTV